MGGILGGGSSKETVIQKSSTELPDWVVREGENLYNQASQAASRPYPLYDFSRIAPFNQDETAAFDLARGNIGNYQPAYDKAFQAGETALTPVGAEDIERFQNPYTQDVINTSVDRLLRQFNRDTIQRHGSMANRGSYLNEDRREVIDNLARESNSRVLSEMISGLNLRGFEGALGQANTEKERALAGGQLFGNLGPSLQGQNFADVAALQAIGGQQGAKDQSELDLAYGDFLRQFGYPQDQINYLLGVLHGIPFETTSVQQGQQIVPDSNPFAAALGGAATVAGLGGQSGFGWWG